jgi:hypothetical protein
MVRSNKRSKKMKWGGDPSDSGATTNDYSTVSPVGGPPNPNSNPPVGGPPPASDTDEKSIFGKIGDKFTGLFSSEKSPEEKSPEDLAAEMKEAQDQVNKYTAVLSELKQKQATQVKTGGRRRSRRTKRSNKKRTNKRRHR